jgi:hypothetical protein
MFLQQRGRQLVAVIGTITIVASAALAGPTAAWAAYLPDYRAILWPGRTETVSSETFEVWAHMERDNGVTGPVRVDMVFDNAFQSVQLTENGGYHCTREVTPEGGLFPGVWFSCTKYTMVPQTFKFRVTSPRSSGNYSINMMVSPSDTDDADPSDNNVGVWIHVR